RWGRARRSASRCRSTAPARNTCMRRSDPCRCILYRIRKGDPMPNEFRTSIGGQALMEGIMMRGPHTICCAVRRPDGEIDLTYDTVRTHWYNKVPLVRGVCTMAE